MIAVLAVRTGISPAELRDLPISDLRAMLDVLKGKGR